MSIDRVLSIYIEYSHKVLFMINSSHSIHLNSTIYFIIRIFQKQQSDDFTKLANNNI